jgi:hypothetical protein
MSLRLFVRLASVTLLTVGLGIACGQQGEGDRCDKANGDNDCDTSSGMQCKQSVGAQFFVCCPPSGSPLADGDTVCPTTSNSSDAGPTTDSGASDTGSTTDAATTDTGAGDATTGDTGVADTTTSDTGAAESSTSDTGAADAATDG